MKISIFATEDALQFNLKAETPHEKQFLAILTEASGRTATIMSDADIGMTQGGYIRSFGETRETCTTITLRSDPVGSEGETK